MNRFMNRLMNRYIQRKQSSGTRLPFKSEIFYRRLTVNVKTTIKSRYRREIYFKQNL